MLSLSKHERKLRVALGSYFTIPARRAVEKDAAVARAPKLIRIAGGMDQGVNVGMGNGLEQIAGERNVRTRESALKTNS